MISAGSPSKGSPRGRPLGACFLAFSQQQLSTAFPIGAQLPHQVFWNPSGRSWLGLLLQSRLNLTGHYWYWSLSPVCKPKLQLPSVRTFSITQKALFSAKKNHSGGQTAWVPAKDVTKVLRRGLSCCPGPTVGLSSVGLEEKSRHLNGLGEAAGGWTERPFPMAESGPQW